MFEIARWSFAHLATKTRPSCRHDGAPFGQSDRWRAKQHSERGRLPLRGVVCQIKGDWKMFKE
eukprot:896482-Pyramimonas_sp.AAC.1